MLMEQETTYIPLQLQNQAARLIQQRAAPLQLVLSESLLEIVRSAHKLPVSQVKALSFMIPTSQLVNLLAIICDNLQSQLKETAFQLLISRLRLRLAVPVWNCFQSDPDNPEIVDLLIALAALQQNDQESVDHPGVTRPAFLEMISRILLMAKQSTGNYELLTEMLLNNLIDNELGQETCKKVFQRYELNFTTRFTSVLLLRFFTTCKAEDFTGNLDIFFDLLLIADQKNEWPLINHYLAQVQPDILDDRIGQHVDSKLFAANSSDGNDVDPMNPSARKHFEEWKFTL
jgi:hypothetical protein